MLLILFLGVVHAEVSAPVTPTELFVQAESARYTDHALFLSLLGQLHQKEAVLSLQQKAHLRYLQAWQAAFTGKLDEATPALQDIFQHSGDPALVTRASALLTNVLARGRHYEEAYKQLNKLTSSLPTVTDRKARTEALLGISQVLSLAGQNDLALKYVKQIQAEVVTQENRCVTSTYALNALAWAHKLSSSDPQLHQAIDTCVADKQAVFTNGLRLDLADLLTAEGHTKQAIVLLKSIEPSILRSGYQPSIAGRDVSLAQAYAKQGDDLSAKQAALAAVSASAPGSLSWELQGAYSQLYEIEKRAHNDQDALSYYEKYVVQYKAAMDDAKTRSLAYQMVSQDVLAKKMNLDALTKQNRILELRDALASQAQETSRLLIVLLLLLLGFIVGAMFWLRRSQLRFRRMARHDGLTGAFNRGYFFEEAAKLLRRLHKVEAAVCLVVMDLDHFKRVNDTHGHPAGDEVLRHTVTICRRELRDSDVFGRLGGEEFGILMPACSPEQGAEVASRIRRALIENPMVLEEHLPIMVSASFGMSCSDLSGYQLHQLFGDADAALYRAKEGGRNQLVTAMDGHAHGHVHASVITMTGSSAVAAI